MAKIPTADYGQRPSLDVGRVDVPGRAGIATANALVDASNVFAQVVKERGEKRNQIEYATAKSELLLDDMKARQALDESDDPETYEEMYSQKMRDSIDFATSRIRNEDDRAIFQAEADVIYQRGVGNVAVHKRKVQGDIAVADLNEYLVRMKEQISLADPATGQAMMFAAHEHINAVESANHTIFSDTDAQAARFTFTQDVVGSILSTMTAKERQSVIEKSLAVRKAEGPITPDDLKAGKGSGSIADFLPVGDLKKLLKIAQNENKIEDTKGKAYALLDGLSDQYGDDHKSIYKGLRSEKDADVRKMAEQLHRQKIEDIKRIENEEKADRDNEVMERIANGDSPAQVAIDIPKVWGIMTQAEKDDAENYYIMKEQGREYALVDNEDWIFAIDKMTAKERRETNFSHMKWKTRLTYATVARYSEDAGNRRRAYSAQSEEDRQKALAALGKTESLEQLFTTRTAALEIFNREIQSGESKGDLVAKNNIQRALLKEAFMKAIRRAEAANKQPLTDAEENAVYDMVLGKEVWRDTGENSWPYIKRGGFSVIEFGRDDILRKDHWSTLTNEQKQEGFIPAELLKNDPGYIYKYKDKLGGDRQDQIYPYLENLAKSFNRTVTQRDIEEAAVYLMNVDEKAAINRLFGIEGY